MALHGETTLNVPPSSSPILSRTAPAGQTGLGRPPRPPTNRTRSRFRCRSPRRTHPPIPSSTPHPCSHLHAGLACLRHHDHLRAGHHRYFAWLRHGRHRCEDSPRHLTQLCCGCPLPEASPAARADSCHHCGASYGIGHVVRGCRVRHHLRVIA